MNQQLKNDRAFSTLVFEEMNNDPSDSQSVSQFDYVFAKTLMKIEMYICFWGGSLFPLLFIIHLCINADWNVYKNHNTFQYIYFCRILFFVFVFLCVYVYVIVNYFLGDFFIISRYYFVLYAFYDPLLFYCYGSCVTESDYTNSLRTV